MTDLRCPCRASSRGTFPPSPTTQPSRSGLRKPTSCGPRRRGDASGRVAVDTLRARAMPRRVELFHAAAPAIPETTTWSARYAPLCTGAICDSVVVSVGKTPGRGAGRRGGAAPPTQFRTPNAGEPRASRCPPAFGGVAMSRRIGIRLIDAPDRRVWETCRPGPSYGGHRSRGGPPSAPPSAPVLERAGSHTRTSRPRCPCLFQSRCGLGREAFWSPSRRPGAPREQ